MKKGFSWKNNTRFGVYFFVLPKHGGEDEEDCKRLLAGGRSGKGP